MDLRERIASLMPQARDELEEFVAIRSVADAFPFGRNLVPKQTR